MNILVIGAGVIGSIYAAQLKLAGNSVAVLARGQRLAELNEKGIVLEEAPGGRRIATRVETLDRLEPGSAFDLVLVIMRRNAVSAVLPMLAANHATPNVLFIGNDVTGGAEYMAALGNERVLLGFATTGGTRENGGVRFVAGSRGRSRITFGEVDGGMSLRLLECARIFNQAGFQAQISTNMDAWLKTHWAMAGPIAGALYLAGGDNYRLARTRDGIVLLIRAMREGFQALRALGIPLEPRGAYLYAWLPEPLLVAALSRAAGTRLAELALAAHANAARDEMQALSREFRKLIRESGVPTPALDRLDQYFDPAVPPLPEGSATISMDWRGVMVVGAAVSLALLFAFGPPAKRRKRR